MSASSHQSSDGFTGLEAAIVLIAFIVVASVFSYVILGAGFFTTQKAQETVYKSVEEASTNVQVVGNVYGIQDGSSGINEIRFSLKLTTGSPSVDISKMQIIFSTPATDPATLHQGTVADLSTFTVKESGTTPVTMLQENEQVEIAFKVKPVTANTKMNIEVRPVIGAVIPFSKTAPAFIDHTNILH